MTWFNPNSVVVPNVTWSHHPKDVIRSMREGQAAAEFLDSYQGAVNPYGIAMTLRRYIRILRQPMKECLQIVAIIDR